MPRPNNNNSSPAHREETYTQTTRLLDGYIRDRFNRAIPAKKEEDLAWYLGDNQGNHYDGQRHLDSIILGLRAANGWGRTLGTIAMGYHGNDTMFGTRYRDTIVGHQGNDSLLGRDGNDVLYGGEGNDHLDGGAGNDTLAGGDGSDYIRGGGGADLIYVSRLFRNEEVRSFETEWVYAGGGNDTVHGQQGKDFISGGSGNNLIYGEGGNDIIIGGANDDRIHGGHGDDRIIGHNGTNKLWGSEGNDTLLGGTGKDDLTGGDGNDKMFDRGGDTWFFGGDGADEFYVNRRQRGSVVEDLKDSGDKVIFEDGFNNVHGYQITFNGDDMVFKIGSTEIFRIQDMRPEILQGDIRTTIDDRNRMIIEHI